MNDTCAGCSQLKDNQGRAYCERTGLSISGTLERSEKCKRGQGHLGKVVIIQEDIKGTHLFNTETGDGYM